MLLPFEFFTFVMNQDLSYLGRTFTVKFVLYFSKPFAVHNFCVLSYFHLYSEAQSTKSANRVPIDRRWLVVFIS